MINLISDQQRNEIYYSKQNATILKYMAFVVVVSLALSSILVGGNLYASKLVSQTQENIDVSKKQIEQLSQIEEEAEKIEDKLKAVEKILASQTKFSDLLDDIADVIPRGAVLTNVSLTGDQKTPITISASVANYESAAILRNALVTSERFSEADIQTVVFNEDSSRFDVSIVLGYSPGVTR